MSSKPLEIGTRDLCRHCDRKIIYLRKEASSGLYRSHYYWTHMLPQGRHKEECPDRIQRDKQKWTSIRAEPKSYCWESVHDSVSWHSRYCQRPVKDATLFMCGIHAKRVRDQEVKEARAQQTHEIQSYMSEQLDQVIKHLQDEFGLETSKYSWIPAGEWRSRYNGELRVDAAKLLNLLTEMRDEERF